MMRPVYNPNKIWQRHFDKRISKTIYPTPSPKTNAESSWTSSVYIRNSKMALTLEHINVNYNINRFLKNDPLSWWRSYLIEFW